MANIAENFAYQMRLRWDDTSPHVPRSEDALFYAARVGGVRIADATPHMGWDVFLTIEGDHPAGMFRFPDGSHYIIADNGSQIMRPARRWTQLQRLVA